MVFPGGFGAAKNLSNFAFEGPNLTVNEGVEKVLRDFHKAGNFVYHQTLDLKVIN